MSLNGLSGYLDIPNANLRVAGAGQFSSLNVGSARVFASYDLDVVTAKGNTTPYTIEFSNATTGFATSSNAQIGGDLTVSSNLTVAGDTTVSSNLTVAGNTTVSSNLELSSNLILNEDLFLVGNTQIHINSNVVTEFTGPHGRPQATLTKFPEIQMTVAAQAGYVVSASAEDSANDRYAWKAFNNILPANSSTDFWFSGSSRGAYTGGSSGREYVGSSNLGTDSGRTATVDGEWIQVHLPYKIQLTTFNIFGQPNTINNFPASGVLYARNETTEDWTSIYVYNDVVISTNNTKATHTLTTSTFYNTYALSITKKSNSIGGVSVGELKLFGTPEVETAGNISQDTTLKSIYNTPSNLDANVYLDGDLGATLTNQISGGPTLTGTGATYDSAGKYWSLDGSTESNVVTGDLAFQGDQPHSVSLWFNSSNLEANVANSTIYHIGTAAATGDATHKVRIVNKSLSWNYENDIPLKANTWHHLTHTYEGVGGYRTLYLDGRKVESAYAGDTSGDFPPFGMTGYSQHGYTVTSSSEYSTGYAPWMAINDNTVNYWSSGGVERYLKYSGGIWNTTYNTADFLTTVGGTSYYGEWLEIEMPQKIYPYFFTILRFSGQPLRAPADGVLVGYNDVEKTWELVGSFSGLTNIATGHAIETTAQNKTYKRFRFVTTKLIGGDTDGDGGFLALGKLEIHGHKENDLIRFPDATNVRKYPDVVMYGPAQRGYTASASGVYLTNSPWKAFDGDTAVSHYHGALSLYNSSTGAYTGSNSLNGINGEWVILQLPYKVDLSYVHIYPRLVSSTAANQSADNISIVGSNDGSSWTTLTSVTGLTYTDNTPTVITVNSSTGYKYFGFIGQKIIAQPGNWTNWALTQIELYGTQESTPVLARLGGAFEGKVANFRVYNKCIKEDQALELWDAQKDQFGLAKSSMTFYKGRVGIGTTEPQAALTVADEVAIPKSGEFPPGAMTNYETYFKDHGLFRASASSEYNTTSFSAWKAFNREWDNNNECWASGNVTVTAGTGLPSSTAANFQGTLGNWLQLELPYKIYLNQFKFESRTDSLAPEELPGSGIVYGSNDEVNWDVVHSFSGVNYGGATGTIRPLFTVNSTTSYSIYRLLVTANYLPLTDFTAIGEWRLFGTPETTTKYSTLHDGELTLTKSLNVPRIGPALSQRDLIPRRENLQIEYDTSSRTHYESLVYGVVDSSGKQNGGIIGGSPSYNPGVRAFKFNGGSDIIYSQSPSFFYTGNFVHTFSTWVRFSSLPTGAAAAYLFSGGGTSAGTAILHAVTNDGSRLSFSLDTYYIHYNYNFQIGQWYNITTVYDGKLDRNRVRSYVNGVQLTDVVASSNEGAILDLTASPSAHFGKYFNNTANTLYGYMSGMRFYDVALTGGEALQIYNAGRNFDASFLRIQDTAVSIGSHTPVVALDVGGRIKSQYSTVLTFTGQHRCVPEGPMEPGLIVSADKNKYINLNGGLKTGSKAITIDESLPVVALSNVSQDKSCFGVVSSVEGVGTARSDNVGAIISEAPKVLGDNRAIVNSVGEGALWVVNTGGPLESGDYVTTSNVAGYGQRQDDDVLHNYTVAKITMDCDFTASNVAIQAPKKVETLVTVEEGVWSNLSAYNRSSETQTQYINGENVVLTEGEWSNLATEEQNTYSDTTITTYYEIRRGENLLDENGNIQWEDTDGVEPGYKVRFLTSDGTQTDEANAVHIAAFVGCTYHCG